MDHMSDRRPDEVKPLRPEPAHDSPPRPRDAAAPPDHPPVIVPPAHAAPAPSHPWIKWVLLAAALVGLGIGTMFGFPWLVTALTTVSTDDAYVNGHATFVAPRVAGQVTEVLVDDNMRVKKGAILVQLDKEPYEIQVRIKQSAVKTAETNLDAAKAHVRAQEALLRSQRWIMQNAIEQVNNQIANLRSNKAVWDSKKASLELAKANLKRGEELAPGGGISKEELETRRQAVKVAEAAVEQALQAIYSTRVSLGLPDQPPEGHELTEVPADLDQNYSGVRSALAAAMQTLSQLGLPLVSTNATPNEVLAEFKKRDAKGDIDRVLEDLIPKAPEVKQAGAKLFEAQQDLAQADLNLSYCDVVSDIDGVVTRRNVNPGNNVQVGQSLMVVRSLTDIWIDANFKETQLADLRIGQHVRIETDMYGNRRVFEGRITGFTMGTGQTLSLLPPENATGNYVKIVQRLPVRIELNDYNPDKDPLFVGLSVVPYVYYKQPATGPNAGAFLQPEAPLPTAPVPTPQVPAHPVVP